MAEFNRNGWPISIGMGGRFASESVADFGRNTHNAAASLIKDLHELGVENCARVRVGTLHAFCFGLLRREEVFGYLGRHPRPVVTFTKLKVLQFEGGTMLDDLLALGAFGPKRDCTRRILAFEAAWSRMQSDTPGWPQDAVDRHFHEVLISWLRFHRAILIGELVPEALRFLRNNPASDIRSAFDHVLIDEYQDLNRAEQDLIELLAGSGALAIVGDVDQSIYRFRHANPEGIRDYHREHPETHDETLGECRRCPTRVVKIADNLIRHNHPRAAGPRLQPKPGNPRGEIHILQWADVDREANGLAGYIRVLLADRGHSPGDVLVLTPRRLLGYKIRDQLRGLAIPVHSFYHEEALEGLAAQRAFAVLSLLVDIEDRIALRWWLGDGSPSRRRNAYRRLRAHCEQTGMSPRAALEALDDGTVALPHLGALVRKYRELREILQTLQGRGLAEIVGTLMPEDNEECSVLREVSSLSVPEVSDVGALFERIKNHVTQPEMPEAGDFVRVMSLHKSKGLTSKIVIVTGCIQGLIPFQDDDEAPAEQEAILQEQRRLFYVAVTRCTEILVLSSALCMERQLAWRIGARLARGRSDVGRVAASRFMAELGPEAPDALRGEDWAEAGFLS